MTNISVIGSGTMGNGIAHIFAQAGYKVTLIDIAKEQLEKALAGIEKNLDRMIKKRPRQMARLIRAAHRMAGPDLDKLVSSAENGRGAKRRRAVVGRR